MSGIYWRYDAQGNRSKYRWAWWRDIHGDRKRKSTQTAVLKDAEEKLRQWESADCVRRPDPFPIHDALVLTGQTQIDKGNSLGWRERCAKIAEQHLIPILGGNTDLNLANLHELGDRYLRIRREQFAPSGQTVSLATIRKELLVLRQGMRRGKRHGLFFGEPGQILPDALKGAGKVVDTWLTPEQFARLLEAATSHRRDWLIFCVQTGIDLGPLHRIRVSDIDFAQGEFGAVHIRDTKTKFRDRHVPLSADARAVVDRRRQLQGEFLFEPVWTSSQFRLCMNRWCARADVPRVTYKDLRRSFCSWMCQAGVPMHHVTRLMGHGSSQMVQRVYGHLAPETYEQAIAKMPRVTTVSQAVVIPIETHRKNGDHWGKDCAENTY